ncbi:hypothetical protein BC937DRAFT_93336 [Endogone sp. FLAS-F59071]|nr:hypothetical protein BC937DRAFT_93336 [Endogone sp. FLAS-F59071]|eukprot:RUS21207.1 hypothetical protein BC937DRAFT_93336 [Endogone sp. FLAS-F59071]
MALQDGYWLARTLSDLPSDALGSPDFIQRWFAAFNERRVRETRDIVLTSRNLGRVKQGLVQELQAEDWDLTIEGDEFAALAKDGIEAA